MQSLHFLKVLGAGAMGSVYLAEMVSGHNFRRQIAVKIIKNEAQDAAPFISRMRDEARLLGLLQDDEILQVLNLVHIKGRDAILMEYVEGVDLAKIAGNNISISPKAITTLGAISAGVLHKRTLLSITYSTTFKCCSSTLNPQTSWSQKRCVKIVTLV